MIDQSVLDVTGRIFDIQRFSIHDGPGIRTTVFLKGCPLSCVWCHNPESISPEKLLSFLPDKCIGCGYCFEVCPAGAHVMVDGVHVINRDKCQICGKCVEKCYAKALEIVGRGVTVAEVLADVLADKPFYETSDGGMTLSGGEPLYQPEFTMALLQAAKAEGLHCCLDTCGAVSFELLAATMPLVDLFLYDIKDISAEHHKANVGADNALILANIRKLHDAGARVRMRAPIIPGCNDRADNLEGIADLALSMENLEGVEIMPYHRLGMGKLDRFGLKGGVPHQPDSPSDEDVARWISVLTDKGVKVLNEIKRSSD